MPSTIPPSMPSPYSEPLRDSLSPLPQSKPTRPDKMLKIQSLLNPTTQDVPRQHHHRSASPPPTPAYTNQSASPSSSPRVEGTHTPSPTKRQKLVKDAAVFVRGIVKGAVNYPPFECTEDPICLSDTQRKELAVQHQRHDVFPSGQDSQGLIGDYVRHIPYSSEKKSFFGKTGREAFDVFQYTFRVPDDPEKRTHTVMWDYQVGLVRITPFFKACKYSKTTPAKALTTNAGLKELSHSITGGALAAQGYWMPYSCARAICLTFAYPIRWTLTPIFGPSFVKECLKPDHPGFARFKIEREVVRCASLEAEGWKAASRRGTPASYDNGADVNQIPRSAPECNATDGGKQLRPRKEKPTFKAGSPFDSSEDGYASAGDHYTYAPSHSVIESPAISPKTTPFEPPTWASINTPRRILPASTPRALANSPAESPLSSRPAFAETSPYSLTAGWRAATPMIHNDSRDQARCPPLKRVNSRNAVDNDDDYVDAPADTSTSSDSSENAPSRLSVSPVKKRKRCDQAPAVAPTHVVPSPRQPLAPGQSQKYTATEARAAHWLLKLSLRDSQLAKAGGVGAGHGAGVDAEVGSRNVHGQKRRASVL